MATTPLDDPRDLAFERMYQRYVQDVYRYALAVLRNPADAEDVTQTTFMNAYRAFKDGTDIEKPQNWLIKIAHNACRTRFIRAQRRPQEVPLEDSVDRLIVPESEKPNIRSILRALGQLPFNQRSALVMRELEGRSYEEIADTLGVSVSAVETLIFRARRSLRLKASSLRALGLVQLPSTLRSFWEGGGAEAVTTGGALVGGGVAFKAVAVLVAGLVAGGAGYKAVSAGVVSPSAKKAHAHGRQLTAVLALSYGVSNRELPGRASQGAAGTQPTVGARARAARLAPEDARQKGATVVSQIAGGPSVGAGGSGQAAESAPAAGGAGSAPGGGAVSPPSVPKLPQPPAVPTVTNPVAPPVPGLPQPPPAPPLPSPPPLPTPPTVTVPSVPPTPPPPSLP